MRARKPVIGIPADRRLLGPHWFHCVGEKYIKAVAEAADAVPVLIPALGEGHLQEWLDRFDGILFTGSPSNVEPHRYQGPPSDPDTWHDPERDATTLPMIPAAIAAGLPVLGIPVTIVLGTCYFAVRLAGEVATLINAPLAMRLSIAKQTH